MIQAIGLTKKYDKVNALECLNLEIPEGEIFGLLGPNGAGKTTAVKIFTGLLKPTSGRALIDGLDIQKEPEKAKKLIGLIPDNPFIYQKLTGCEFLNFIGDLYEVPESIRSKKISEYFEMFELTEYRNKLVEDYSHGMKQKIVISAVLLHNPKNIFLDEPMVGLDPKGARLVKDILFELSKRGASIFMCTHTLEIAEKLCHRIGIIDKGRLIAVGSKEQLRILAQDKGPAVINDNLEDIFLKLTGAGEFDGIFIDP